MSKLRLVHLAFTERNRALGEIQFSPVKSTNVPGLGKSRFRQ